MVALFAEVALEAQPHVFLQSPFIRCWRYSPCRLLRLRFHQSEFVFFLEVFGVLGYELLLLLVDLRFFGSDGIHGSQEATVGSPDVNFG